MAAQSLPWQLNMESLTQELSELLNALSVAARGGDQTLTSSAPSLHRDLAVFAVCTLVMFLFNWFVRLFFVEPFIKSFLGIRGSVVQRFAQSVMEIIFYGSFTILGLLVVPRQIWSWPSSLWWSGWIAGGHEIMRADLRFYYILYVARYFQGGISVFMEHKRKDFLEMQIYHWATVILIAVSYTYGWNRIGSIIMLLLDPADVPLHLAKVCKYVHDCTGKAAWQVFADRLFVVFGIVFAVTRLICYPYVCWSAHIESSRHFPHGLPERTCVGLLYILMVLQVYWFSLVLKVAWRLLFTNENAGDSRSDDDFEDDGVAVAPTVAEEGVRRRAKEQ